MVEAGVDCPNIKNCLLDTSAEGLPTAPGPLEKLNAGAELLTTGAFEVDDEGVVCPKENMLGLFASSDGVVVAPNVKGLFSADLSTEAGGVCPKENAPVGADVVLNMGFGGSDEGGWVAGVAKKFG